MGRFFTSTQIYNPKQLDRDGFKAYFCEKMKKEGYEVCEADCAELSYVLAFSENCKWVTLSSEAYEQGNRTAQADTARIAKMLGTYCVNTIVIDSDCAMLDLYNDKGKKADTLVMGRADDYLGDDIPAPAQAVWEQFVSPDSTWEQFMSVVQGDYVFVEDGLSELAPVIGMDSDNILFEYEDADESNEKLCYLSFKKTASKKEKKPTLNSLFQQIWGAELEPLGFKKPKLRLPYYIRVINDEIIHVVGIHDMKSHLVAFGGIATVYRKELCLNHSFRQNERWLRDVMDFYVTWRISDKPFNQEIQSGFHYHEYIESQPLSKAVQDALNETMTWIVPVLDNIKTLKDVADYEERVFKDYISIISLPLNESLAAPYSDAAIKFILDDPLADLEQRYLHYVKNIEEVNKRFNRPQEIIEKDRIFIEEMLKDSRETLHMFLEDKELHSQTLEELARRKKYNLEMLKSYGIDFEKTQPKKEKKLTLNAAFKQVFGELLEPMGFKLIKSKYPYYLRVVGEGIIQAISFAKKKSLNLDLNRDEEEVEIYVGISLLSNPLINFDKNPTIIDNQVWMISLNELYRRFIVYMDGFNRKHEEYSFFYQKGNIEEVINALKQSRDELMPFVLEFLEKPKTLEDIYRLGEITSGIRHDTIILLQKIDELIKELKENLTKKIEMLESVHKDNPERLELLKKRAIEGSEKSIEYFGSFKKGGEKYDDYIKTAEKTKEDNLEKLKQLGIL